ncbi:hypothetical protein GCM10023205_77970 [Yinghuangia aomiensis]|uniref:Uncharacterized protein n=1 Tax=Yinghuangia aomiensis TaxID=676205 RepID=A0ABP9ICD4_9ACTN
MPSRVTAVTAVTATAERTGSKRRPTTPEPPGRNAPPHAGGGPSRTPTRILVRNHPAASGKLSGGGFA